MDSSRDSHRVLKVLAALMFLSAAAFGTVVGISVASMDNLGRIGSFNQENAALPTQILDIKGRLITEFFSDEKRELVSVDQLPPHLLQALITREDQDFYRHAGFSIRGLSRAGWNILTGSYVSGGSTITQQLATSIYLDKSELSLTRKIKELWYSIQLERNLSKQEILEEYLNKMPFGHNTHGVEAASQFFFGHSAKELTVAESVILVLQVSSPAGLYSPLRHPNRARDRQKEILDQMVALGFVSAEDADRSFRQYWDGFDYSRSASETAFFNRVDKAPYFSEYVRELLQTTYLLGTADIYRDGYRVYTTLDLDKQEAADSLMKEGIAQANRRYQSNHSARSRNGADTFVPLVDLLSLNFNVDGLRVGGDKQRSLARRMYLEQLQPLLDLGAMQFDTNGEASLRTALDAGYTQIARINQSNTVEGALISIENDTGHILAMVGGSRFESSNQFNRATMSRIQPGSTFKPLFYAAGIEKGVITPATRINDTQIIFMDEDGVPYRPLNYRGEFKGPVLVRYALAHSMNIPSIRVLNMIGFDDAIGVSSSLLGVPRNELESRNFVRKFPLALGIVSVSPMEMATAFATFPNLGTRVLPVAIRYIEDRRGTIISEPEKEIRQSLVDMGPQARILSPQTSYVMTDLLQSVVSDGTLAYARNLVGGFNMPMAGKTGTPQNWSAAWTLGFSPYMTTAVWLGIDTGNNSLGTNQTGSTTAGPIWARYMKEAHKDLAPRNFARPESGLSRVLVTTASGLLPPPDYKGSTRMEIFRSGTEPREFDNTEAWESEIQGLTMNRLEDKIGYGMDSPDLAAHQDGADLLTLDDDLMNLVFESPEPFASPAPSGTPGALPSASPGTRPSASPSPSPSPTPLVNSFLN